ncbi:MAG: hypothetical protein ACLPX5_02590 [Dissulfurispiraceae bacterium]
MAQRQNYVARMQLNKKNMIAAGLVSERFPGVSRMVIKMTYYQKVSNPVLMVRTVNVLPTGYVYFKMECMVKGCVNGGFDLTSIITNMVKKRKKSGEGSMVCSGKSDPVPPGHASISYEINIEYKKP